MMKRALLIIPILLFSTILFGQKFNTISRDSFSLQYPATWKIDVADPDYDPDALFSIDAPDGENMIMFFVFNMPLDPDEMLNEQVKNYTETIMKTPEIVNFTDWGKFKGKGRILKGKLMGVFKGTIQLFFYTDDHKSFLAMNLIYDSATDETKKELNSIIESFKFKRL